MLNKSLSGFIQDERGSYTMWSVAWFMIYVGIGGLAVDATDVYRHETLLQATADAAALAGVMSLPNETDAVDQALVYAQDNMERTRDGEAVHGTVLTATDVKLGTWSFDERTFYTGATAAPNAVYVTTRREESNGNPLPMNMLRFLSLAGGGDLWWNVHAEAVAVRGIGYCSNGGMVAGGRVSMTSGNVYGDDFCIHGVEGLDVSEGNAFGNDVSVSVTCEGQGCVGSGPNGLDGMMDNEGFPPAWETGGGYTEPLAPLAAKSVDNYVSALMTVPDYDSYSAFDPVVSLEYNTSTFEGWDYMYGSGHPQFQPPEGAPALTDFPTEALITDGEDENPPFTVYHITCTGASGIDLPEGKYRNLAIVATCPIDAPQGRELDMNNVIIASTWDPGAQPKRFGIQFSADGNLGGSTECGPGGVELYTTQSSIKFAAKGQVQNTRIISGWNVNFAAQADGEVGVHVEAVNDINVTAQSTFGLCDGNGPGPREYTYRLMQ